MRKLRILDLFCGTKSIANAFRKLGFEVVTLDLEQKFDPDICIDILKWVYQNYPRGYFDFIWASPPCQAFSVAAIGKHWTGGKWNYIPNDEFTKTSMLIVQKTIEIIEYFNPTYWVIENPIDVLKKLEFMKPLEEYIHTIWYCQYGDIRAKPTSLWGRFPVDFPIRSCYKFSQAEIDGIVEKHCHHEVSQRSMHTGTQGLKDATERAMIPEGFCDLLAQHVMTEISDDPKEYDHMYQSYESKYLRIDMNDFFGSVV